MANSYTELDTTAANFATDVGAALRTNTDWTRPNSGSFPNVHKVTNDDGVDFVLDLQDAAAGTQLVNLAVYRLWANGAGSGTDKLAKAIQYKRVSSGTTANILHVVISWSKNHLLMTIEGPRAAEANTDSASAGSCRQYLFMDRLVPYLSPSPDATPCIVTGISSLSGVVATLSCHLTRNMTNTLSWVPAKIVSLQPFTGDIGWIVNTNKQTVDGTYSDSPYVVDADVEGRRGRLASMFFAGWTVQASGTDGTIAPVGTIQTYGGNNYRLIALNKTDTNTSLFGPLGCVSSAQSAFGSAVAAVLNP